MKIDALTNPTGRAAIDALQSGDRAASLRSSRGCQALRRGTVANTRSRPHASSGKSGLGTVAQRAATKMMAITR